MRALSFLLLASCSANTAAQAEPTACDAEQILEQRCRTCHGPTPKYGAPMSLVTSADVRARDVKGRINNGTMPPSGPLPDNEKRALNAWIDKGAPAATSCKTTPAPEPKALSCKTDVSVRPASAFAVPTSSGDVYVCYGFEPGATSKRHIIGIAPRIDATAVVHHVTLLVADSSVPSTPATCPIAGSSTWRSVFGWAPGGSSLELPKEAGFAFDNNSHYVVQVHYSNPTGKVGLTDTSGFDLCTTSELRPNDADVMAFGAHTFTIPPRAKHSVSCTVQVPSWGATTHLFAAFPHMHTLGSSIATKVYAPDGREVASLGSKDNWDFGNQSWIPIDYTLKPFDTVTTRCAWNNTTDSFVTWGEKTSDEMCYAFVMYWPRITDPAWSWASPAVSSVCVEGT
jgi:hypothetical protein